MGAHHRQDDVRLPWIDARSAGHPLRAPVVDEDALLQRLNVHGSQRSTGRVGRPAAPRGDAHLPDDPQPVPKRVSRLLVQRAVASRSLDGLDELCDVARGHVAGAEGTGALARGGKDQELAIGGKTDMGVVGGGLVVQSGGRHSSYLAQGPGVLVDLGFVPRFTFACHRVGSLLMSGQ